MVWELSKKQVRSSSQIWILSYFLVCGHVDLYYEIPATVEWPIRIAGRAEQSNELVGWLP